MRHRDDLGMTLIELLLAVAGISIGILALVGLLKLTGVGQLQSGLQTRAMGHTKTLLQQILTRPWDEHYASNPTVRGPISPDDRSPIGPDAGEETPAAFDDLDDYNGFQDEADGLTRIVEVRYVDVIGGRVTLADGDGLGTNPSPTERTGYKQVTVRTFWRGGGDRPAQLVKLVADLPRW